MKTIHINDIEVRLRKHHWSKQMKLRISPRGEVSVTIPQRTPYKVAEAFARSQHVWIAHHAQQKSYRGPTKPEREQARALVDRRLQRWGPQISLNWNRVRIGDPKSRWGSCSSKRTLSFSWRLLDLPEELVDYVIVHELSHLVHMNHSPAFWELVERHLPDFRQRRKQLKQIDITRQAE